MKSKRSRRPQTPLRFLIVVVAIAMLGAACGGNDNPAISGAAGEHNEADVTFVQGMIPHHRQAVEMATMVIDKGERADVKDLARRIAAAQGPEIETMEGWRNDWGAAEDEGGMQGGDGMMTDSEMSDMMSSSGAELDRMFLESMTRHHQGAVMMAQAEVDQGMFGPAKDLAGRIIATQQGEIDEMRTLLGARG